MTIAAAPLAVVVARSAGNVIGIAGRLPWHIPTDLARFKALTLGKPVIMGRITFDAIGHALPGRTTILLSHQTPERQSSNVAYAASVLDALRLASCVARDTNAEEVMVAGGEAVYRALLPSVDRLYLTEVDLHVAGDAYFPAFDRTAWHEVATVVPPRAPGDDAAVRFVDMRRCRPDTPL